ncbi:reverse transcriptase domain-containing protein [Tanacetum coccineum]
MTHLLEKNTPFIFSNECIQAFETLKKKLTEAPILIAPDWDLPFELMCDASDFAIGAVLGQRHERHFRPIHYASKTMTEAESHYTTTEKEMLAVVSAFDKFHVLPHLEQKHCVQRIENKAKTNHALAQRLESLVSTQDVPCSNLLRVLSPHIHLSATWLATSDDTSASGYEENYRGTRGTSSLVDRVSYKLTMIGMYGNFLEISSIRMPPGIEDDDYDSEGDIRFLEELLNNDSFPLPENESSNLDHFYDPSSSRPPPKPPDVEI